MKLQLLNIILWCFPILCWSQVNVDSLNSIWEDQSQTDIIRVEALNKICTKEYLYLNPNRAFHFAELAYEFSKEKDLKKEMVDALYSMGVASNHLGNLDTSIYFQNQCIKISEDLEGQDRLIKSLNSLGNVYLKKSDYSNAIACYIRCLKLLEREGDKKRLWKVQNNIGLIYYDLEDYEKALAYLNQALAIRKELGEEKKAGSVLINIGSVYRHQKLYDKALEFYLKGLAIMEEGNEKFGLGICYSNIGLIHKAKGENKKAMSYFKKSMTLHEEAGYQKGIANCLIYFGKMYEGVNLDSTIFYGTQALEIAQKTGNNAEIVNAAELLYKSYKTKKNFREAFEMHQLFQDTKDQIYGARNQKAVLKSELEYIEEKRNLENKISFEKQLRKTQLGIQRLRFVFIGAMALLIFGVVFYLKRRQRKIDSERDELLYKVELLKEKLATQSVSSSVQRKELVLDKIKIEKAIKNKMGESSWLILNLIFQNPSISNKEIAEKVSLSIEGVSSSLRRMYTAFEINSSSNKKITLIMKATRISFED